MRGMVTALAAVAVGLTVGACGDDAAAGRSGAGSGRVATTRTVAEGVRIVTAGYGQPLRTVGRGEELRLTTLAARVDEIVTTPSITNQRGEVATAEGVFVIVRMAIRNRSRVPQTVTTGGGEQIGLLIDGEHFSDDAYVQRNYATDSFLSREPTLQPGAVARGTVVFDVPVRAAGKLDRSGALLVVNFGEAVAPGYLEDATEVGQIELWR